MKWFDLANVKLWSKMKGNLVQALQLKLFNLSYRDLRTFKMPVKLNQLITHKRSYL